MSQALVAALPLALAIAFSPPSIIAVVLVLTTPRAAVNGPAFVVGWLVGLAVIGTAVILVIGPTRAGDEPVPAWHYWLKLLIGLALLGLAVRYIRSRSSDAESKSPGWMNRLDALGIGGATALGLALVLVNPKNLLLALAGGITIVDTVDGRGDQAIAYLLFTVVATIGVATPIVLYYGWRDQAPALLARLRAWMSRHNAVIMAAVCLVLGLILVIDAVVGLAG